MNVDGLLVYVLNFRGLYTTRLDPIQSIAVYRRAIRPTRNPDELQMPWWIVLTAVPLTTAAQAAAGGAAFDTAVLPSPLTGLQGCSKVLLSSVAEEFIGASRLSPVNVDGCPSQCRHQVNELWPLVWLCHRRIWPWRPLLCFHQDTVALDAGVAIRRRSLVHIKICTGAIYQPHGRRWLGWTGMITAYAYVSTRATFSGCHRGIPRNLARAKYWWMCCVCNMCSQAVVCNMIRLDVIVNKIAF